MKIFLRIFIAVFVSIIFNSCATLTGSDKSASDKDIPASVSVRKIKHPGSFKTKHKTQKLQFLQFEKR